MHSRIFQLQVGAYCSDDVLDEDYFIEENPVSIADYYDGNTDYEEDMKWFEHTMKIPLEREEIEGKSIAYFVANKKVLNTLRESMRQRLDYLQTEVEKAKQSFQSSEYPSTDFWRIAEIADPKTEVHFYCLGNSIMNRIGLYFFIRTYANKKIYIVNTIDYHS